MLIKKNHARVPEVRNVTAINFLEEIEMPIFRKLNTIFIQILINMNVVYIFLNNKKGEMN